ncbi:MAG: dienelactone hydrolase family protein [Coriobacteriia bacterium]|nr:dienelactone hydrolase family protein [Coriobacteriia bacterium]
MARQTEQLVAIPSGEVTLEGALQVPESARGVVAFAHGSGSSRHSTRNQQVARALFEAGFGTLLFDLLTIEEDTLYENRFDISLLTARLRAATLYLRDLTETSGLPVGYFGASTGAAAALHAAADLGDMVSAIVSRGGRPDLAMGVLGRVRTPTLLIVGGADEQVLKLNRYALAQIATPEKALEVVTGATHLFEEPGALDSVSRLARDWFERYLS